MSSNKTVSVIVPFYHGNKYIEKLLDVLYKNRINLARINVACEIILVNDSPDTQISVARKELLENVTIINNPVNQGIHQSRVNGLNAARGNYVLFLDQDDLITEDCLSSQIKAIGENDYVIANGFKTDSKDKYVLYKDMKSHKKCLKSLYFYFYTCPIISPGLVLIKKEAIPDEWKENILKHNGSDDYYLWLLMLENKAKGTINPDYVYIHVFTGQNTSLDPIYMRESTSEVLDLLKDKITGWKRFCIKRRTDYFCNKPNTLFAKIRFLDVCILRFLFGRVF